MKLALTCVLTLLFAVQIFSLQKNKQLTPQSNSNTLPAYTYNSTGRVEKSTGIVRSQYHTDKQIFSGSSEEIARTYLRLHHQTFGLSATTNELALQTVQQSPVASHVRFDQTYNSIPVFHGDVVVSINRNNQVVFVANNSKAMAELQNIQPSLTATDATTLAHSELNIRGQILFEEAPKLMIFAEGTSPLLTYRTVISTNTPPRRLGNIC